MSTLKMVPQLLAIAFIAYSAPVFAQQKRMNDYSSPKAVYESMREASKRRDWESYLACFTTAAQKDKLLNVFIACALVNNEEGKRFVGTFIDDPQEFFEDHEKRKQAKLSALAAKGDKTALQEAQEKYKTVYTDDDFRDTLFDHICDKAGYYGAARALLESPLRSVLGEFEEAVVTGDTATGTAKMTMFHLSGGKKVADEDTKTFNFRKIDGKWLIDVP